MKRFILLTILLASVTAVAKPKEKDLKSDMDALGGNKDLMERANAIDPKNRIRVVQQREVDRDMRFELGANYGVVAGGDPYLDTNNLGVQGEFHLTPRWSIGGRFYQSANTLSSEGKRIFDQVDAARAQGSLQPRPDIDYVKTTWFGTITFYPLYGKISFLDLGVTQFDIYFVAGYGQVNSTYGTAGAFTGGTGLAFWFTQHFSTRIEARYQGYRSSLANSDSRQMNLTVLTAGVGFLF